MTRKGLLTIFGIISLTGFLVHCGQEDTAFTSQDASAFAGKVAGRVVDKNGSAVNGALVTLRPGGTTTVSGDSGKYEFGSVTSGKYRVEFTKADYRDTARRDSVTLGLLQTDSLGASPLCYRYATVSGSIPNLSNASSVSVVVENQGATVTAVSNEHFILTKVDPGSVRLFAVAKEGGYGVKNVTLTAGDTSDIGSFAIDHVGGTVTGKVVDASGKAAASATVTAVGGLLSTTTDTAGAFSLANVPSSATVTIAKNTQGVTVSGVAVKAGGSTDLSTLRLSTLTTGTLPSLEDGYAVGLTTDSVITLVAVTAAGSDTSWHIHRYLWNAGSGWDTTRTNVRRLTPSSLGGAGSSVVSVKASLYKLSGGLLLDSVTSPAAITVHISLPLDTAPPALARVSPISDTSTHVWTDSVVTVSWKVSDDRKLDTVWLGGRVAAVTGGVVSKTDTLSVGATTVRVVARDSSGNVTRDSVTLIRLPESATDLSLSGLVLGTGSLTPSFSSSTLSYTDTLASTDSSLVLTAKIADATALLSIGGMTATSGKADTISVKKDTTVSIVVSRGSSALTYTVKVVHKAARASGASASGTFKDARDGQSYKWVTIGTQTWMAQNLNYRKTTGSTDTVGVCYNYADSNCTTYGRLYTWAEAMGLDTSYNSKYWQGSDSAQHQGICPSGWHVPSDAEWNALVQYVDSATSGRNLKANSSLWSANTGTDVYGFSVLPAGLRNSSGGTFGYLGLDAIFWSSFETAAWSFNYYDANVNRLGYYKLFGFSLRCLQNSSVTTIVARDSTLSSLTTSVGSLTSLFSSSALSYTDTVASGVTSVVLAATATAPVDVDSIRYNGLPSGVISLSSDTTKVLVAVYNKNKNSLTYTVTIIRASSSATGANVQAWTTETFDNLGLSDGNTRGNGIALGNFKYYSSNGSGIYYDKVNSLGSGGSGVIQRNWNGVDVTSLSFTRSDRSAFSLKQVFLWDTNKGGSSTNTVKAFRNGKLSYDTSVSAFDSTTKVFNWTNIDSVVILDTPDLYTNVDNIVWEAYVLPTVATGASASGTFTDSRDGQTYKWVTIGTQTWMAQNLNYNTANDTGSWCYNDSSANCTTYGRLYTWATAMGLDTSYNSKLWQGSDSAKHQGICPSGWHVPTDTEWGTLFAYVGSDSARIRLSSTSGWASIVAGTSIIKDNTNGTNWYSFNVFPVGWRSGSYFSFIDTTSCFWSSSEVNAAYTKGLNFSTTAIQISDTNNIKTSGFSLRCLKTD